MDLPDYQIPELQKKHVFILVVALGLVFSVYFQIPGVLYKNDEERAISIAENNEFMSEYREQNGVEEISTSNLDASTVQELKESGDFPQSASNNIYIVDYMNNQQMGVSAYVDLSSGEVVDTKYNYRIN